MAISTEYGKIYGLCRTCCAKDGFLCNVWDAKCDGCGQETPDIVWTMERPETCLREALGKTFVLIQSDSAIDHEGTLIRAPNYDIAVRRLAELLDIPTNVVAGYQHVILRGDPDFMRETLDSDDFIIEIGD